VREGEMGMKKNPLPSQIFKKLVNKNAIKAKIGDPAPPPAMYP
jgi:hypothetical protein